MPPYSMLTGQRLFSFKAVEPWLRDRGPPTCSNLPPFVTAPSPGLAELHWKKYSEEKEDKEESGTQLPRAKDCANSRVRMLMPCFDGAELGLFWIGPDRLIY